MEWIKISDAQPTEDGRYLVWCSEQTWELAVWFEDSWSFAKDSLNCSDVTVTHWISLDPPTDI